MQKSPWQVATNGRLVRKGIAPDNPRILLLDNNHGFRTRLKRVARTFIPQASFLEFNNGDKAFEFMEREIKNNRQIDLIVTDIDHPGIKGVEWVKRLRILELNSHNRTPVIVVSNTNPEYYLDLLNFKLIDHYLTKQYTLADMVEKMEEVIWK